VPGWTWIFLLLGLLPVVIVQSMTQVTADGRVPLVPERRRRIALVRIITAGLVVGGILTLVAALILGALEGTGAVSALLFGLTPLLLLGGILAGIIGNAVVRVRGSVHRHPSVPDRWIVLDAHPAFGAAVESWRAGYVQPLPPAAGAPSAPTGA
jgi:hypothetical protein